MNHNFSISPSFTNGSKGPVLRNTMSDLKLPPPPASLINNAEGMARFEAVLNHVMSARSNIFSKFGDPRRDIDDDCGFPTSHAPIDADEYRLLYEREPIPAKVVEFMARESWQVQPEVYEEEDEDSESAFDVDFREMCNGLRGEHNWCQDGDGNLLWEFLRRADELSGIGHFGVVLLGFDDFGKNEEPNYALPVKGIEEENSMPAGLLKNEDGSPRMTVTTNRKGKETSTPVLEEVEYRGRYKLTLNQQVLKKRKRKLLFLRAFDESQVDIVRWESNRSSPRYGQPVAYSITLNSSDISAGHSSIGLTMSTVEVHWSRILHLADVHHTPSSSEIFAVPRLRNVYNNCYNIRKASHASGEGYWRSCFTGLALSTHPQLGGDVIIDKTAVRDEVEQYMNTLQRFLVLSGMSAEPLAPSVVDPTPFIMAQIQLICIKINVPQRIFMGSERGQLASGQDDGDWNDELRGRQVGYISPRIIAPLVNRLIMVNVLTEPKQFYTSWPDLSKRSEMEMADVALKKTTAVTTYVQGGGEALITPLNFFTKFLGMEQEEALAMLEDTMSAAEQVESGEGSDTGKSPLLGLVGGITGMIELFKLAKDGGLSEEQLKQQIMLFFGVSEDVADQLIADGLTPTADEAGAGMEAEIEKEGMKIEEGVAPDPTEVEPMPPVKVKEGEKLVQPKNPFSANEGVENAELTGGRWITTEAGNRVYIKDGEPVAGNPKVLKAMKDGSGKSTSEAKDKGGKETKEIKRLPSFVTGSKNSDLPDGARSYLKTSTEDELKALHDYTGGHAFRMNAALREGGKVPASLREEHERLQSLFDKNPDLKEPITVYRSMSMSSENATAFVDGLRASSKRGEPFESAGYVSTTSSRKDTEGSPVEMVIKARNGIDTTPLTKGDKSEKEMLLSAGSKFKIGSISKVAGGYRVELEQS